MSTVTKELAKEATKASKKKENGNGHGEKHMEIPSIDFRQVTFTIEGQTPLIVNKFSEKAQQMMLDKQTKAATKGKEAKDPHQQYINSLYFFEDGKRTGFPAVGLKAAMTRASKQLGWAMTDTRGKFHVLAKENDLIEIKGKHSMRQDTVRLATGVADIRFRGEYRQWEMEFTISYNASSISAEQLASLVNLAGFACGLGEWRAERSNSGSYGCFKLAEKKKK